ncbi:MAG: triose-phosphate isomerase, partial [Deltaproteobacteria bacterium HGW-Deltaproteobacteria-24]
YGGSVNLGNVEKICALPNVDGALIGTASWVAEDFIKIIENTKEL